MKHEEKIAAAFLKTYFGAEPIHEPLGKSSPPDFRIGSTAFEVRRLNQQYVDGNGTPEGLEQAAIPLTKAVRGEFNKIQFSPSSGSYLWVLHYQRPLHAAVGKIARELARQAHLHYSGANKARHRVASQGVTVELFPVNNANGRAFLQILEVDGDSGGLLNDLYSDSIRLALAEKISKTKNIAGKFSYWILVLVDSIMPGISSGNDVGKITFDLKHFSSIVIINPDGSLAFEWPNHSLKRG